MMYARKEPGLASPWGAGVIRVFESAERVQEAIDKLERGGFDTSKLSVIGKEEPSAARQMGIAVAGAQARMWGQRDALWNRQAKAQAAMALAWVPFIGYVVAVGPLARVLVGGHWQAQADSRISVLARMLTLAGVSPAEVRTYEAAVRGGQILLLVHGGSADAAKARHLLNGPASLSAR